MKLLFYITVNNNGGAERVMTNLANEFVKRGHSIAFVVGFTTENDYALDKEVRLYDLDRKHNNTTASKFLYAFKRIPLLRRVIKCENPDAVISFLPYSILVAIFAIRFIKIPLIVSVRNNPAMTFHNVLTKLGAHFLYSLATGCVFQTHQAMSWFPKQMRGKSVVIGNVVDKRFFITSLADERSGIIGVGRLTKQKCWDVAIVAFSRITADYPGNFTIYGIGEEFDNLHRLADKLNIADRVIFAGNVKNIEQKLREAQVFVMSSEHEGIPNALLEALAIGLPCITTKFTGGACEELLENNLNGIIVPKGDSVALAEALKIVLNNPDILDKLSSNAIAIAEKYNPDSIVAAWETYIADMINEKY